MTLSSTARRTLAAAAITPLLLTGIAACGDDSGGGGDASGEETPAGATLLASLDEGEEVDPGEFVDTVADGLESSTTSRVEMTMSFGDQLSTSAEGDLDYTTDPPSMSMTMDMPGVGETDMVLVDGLVYMRLGEISEGKYWKLDPSDPDGPVAGMGLDQMLEQTDPLGALEKMEAGIDSVTFEGTEDVDGRELDRYELTIDTEAAIGAYGGGGLPDGTAEQLPETVTYDLWLDDEDRFARMVMEMPIMDQQVSVEMDVDDWGKEVDIAAPPADEVTEMPDMGQMPGGTTQS